MSQFTLTWKHEPPRCMTCHKVIYTTAAAPNYIGFCKCEDTKTKGEPR